MKEDYAVKGNYLIHRFTAQHHDSAASAFGKGELIVEPISARSEKVSKAAPEDTKTTG